MDSDIEIVEDDISQDSHHEGLLNDFSQVKIEVHGADVAERILKNLTHDDNKEHHNGYIEEQHCPQDVDSDIVEIYDTPDAKPGMYVNLPTSESCDFINESGPTNMVDNVSLRTNPNRYLEEVIEPVLDSNAEKISVDYSEKDDCNYIDEVSEPEMESHETQATGSTGEAADTEMSDHDQSLSYEEITIKEEIEDFDDDMGYTDFDDINTEIGNDTLPPEDIYHYNNKIILGSKPCEKMANANFEEADAENDLKEYLRTEVILEDWGERLEKSVCYCKKCCILFSTPNGLDSHNMTTHSFLVAVSNNKAVKSTAKPPFARKSTGYVHVKNNNIAKKSTGSNNIMASKLCNHCNMVFPNNTDLIKHLYELLPFNKQFSCKICKATFNTQKELISHNSVHVKMEKKVKKDKVVKEKTDFKKNLIYDEDLKKKRLVPPNKDATVIPMSTLFQCLKCNTHFLNSFAGNQHEITCKGASMMLKRTVTCKICKRKLRATDSEKHKKQHQICNKFKVYKITKTIFERTLCKCPKCEVHYNDLTMITHLKNCGKIPTVNCQKCNILIPTSKLYPHMLMHKKQNLKPKDFIIVQYFIQNKTQKRKLETPVTPAKKIKLENKQIKAVPNSKIIVKKSPKVIASKIKKEPAYIKTENGTKKKMIDRLKFEKTKRKIYFCKHCHKCSLIGRQKTHQSKTCIQQDKIVCEECGLHFQRKSIAAHKNHHKKRKLTIHDMIFYSILTLKRTIPTMPTYEHCENCNIKFLNLKGKKSHICGENYKTCKICGDKFDISALKVHIEFHKLIKTQPQKQKTETKMMPELLKKYESLNMMWNLLYSCNTCDVVTDAYDKVIEHSQTHLMNDASSKNIKCYICNLKFDETCWSKHSNLHSRMNINSKDFKILNYDPSKLLSEEWFELFASLSEEQIRQITDKSLYGYERAVKMTLVKDGRSEFTLHCCSDCNVCYESNEITKHISSACKSPANFCKVCKMPFSHVNALRFHELLHVKGIKNEEFRVVNFVKSAIKIDSPNVYVVMKCTRCHVSIRYAHNSHRHICVTENRTAKCNICHLVFNRLLMQRHMKEHASNPKFNRKNIKVEWFDPPQPVTKNNGDDDTRPVKRKFNTNTSKTTKPEKVLKANSKPAKADTSKTRNETLKNDVKTAKVFKCECGLHYTSPKTIEKHIETCSVNSDISKENCSKCGLLFPTDVLVSHLCKHHSKNTKIVIELYKKPEEPESSFESVESTSETPTPRKASGKDVSTNTMKSLTQNEEIKLYKCGECNVFYLVQNTCYRHIYKDHKPLEPKQYIECKLCGLQFTINGLKSHIERHHQKELRLENVLVEEYQPRVGKSYPVIDIYMASEKLQSLQVTSSIEESKISDS